MNSPSLIQKKCKCCCKLFMARVVDHEKGLGLFCSKSCKAFFEARTTRPVRSRYRSRILNFEAITQDDLEGLSWT